MSEPHPKRTIVPGQFARIPPPLPGPHDLEHARGLGEARNGFPESGYRYRGADDPAREAQIAAEVAAAKARATALAAERDRNDGLVPGKPGLATTERETCR